MVSFSLPPIQNNPDGGWGPSSSNLPEKFKFKDIPYAPYSKSDKLGRFADWNELSTENRTGAGAGTVGVPSTQQTQRSGTSGTGGRRRDGNQAFGSGTASAFAYFHVEDESSFSLVDNKSAPPRRGSSFTRGRGTTRGGTTTYTARGVPRSGQRGGFQAGRGGQRGARRGWRDWEKVRIMDCGVVVILILVKPLQNNRTRESSVVISPTWTMLDEIEFHRLGKLRLEVDEPENL